MSEEKHKQKSVNVICPNCRKSRILTIPLERFNSTKGVNTISIPPNIICEHTFQIFIDKSFQIRGYQEVDYEFELESSDPIMRKEDFEFDEDFIDPFDLFDEEDEDDDKQEYSKTELNRERKFSPNKSIPKTNSENIEILEAPSKSDVFKEKSLKTLNIAKKGITKGIKGGIKGLKLLKNKIQDGSNTLVENYKTDKATREENVFKSIDINEKRKQEDEDEDGFVF